MVFFFFLLFSPIVPDFYRQEQSGLHVEHMERHTPLHFFDLQCKYYPNNFK